MKKKFTITEKSNGELAVRLMSDKAQQAYYNTDLISICKYTDYILTDDEYVEIDRYAFVDEGVVRSNLTFEEAEKYLEAYYDALLEYDC